ASRERFADLGGFELEPRAKKILSGLAFRESDFDRPARTLSGGWIMRAHLARLLAMEPDLLMLDEPTNHLDLESLTWFQNYLKNYPGAILTISHDREFLNQLVDSIIEIRNGRLDRYRGNYDSFLEQRAAREEQHLAAYANQQRDLQRLQDFVDRFGAKASKASQAQSRLKQIERMEKIEAPVQENRRIRFQFPQPSRTGQKVLSLKQIHHAYGDLVVYRGIDLELERGDRIVLVGPNGAGKSTLLKILAGVLPVQKGERVVGLNVKVGYYSQQRVDTLDERRTVLEEALDSARGVKEQDARSILGSFLFRDDDVFKRVSVLSGGEKSRLALVKLLLDPPNLLLMDEPTTHLDIASIDALVGALEQFQGTVAFISHDVHFIRSIGRKVLHVHSGKLTSYAGNYDYYLEKSAATSERAALTAGGATAATVQVKSERPAPAASHYKSREQRRQEAEERESGAKGRREWERNVARIEAKIIELEKELTSLTAKLELPETYEDSAKTVAVNKDLTRVTSELEAAETQWEELASQTVPK
ncbi:MAG TPA: ABC-F family ATP-binding cassette domain-containing protein, partial [Opitutales bacterium]|nr:ABC-F family ATP-binding cassette domain-containing protein [Opitutales bacterium]